MRPLVRTSASCIYNLITVAIVVATDCVGVLTTWENLLLPPFLLLIKVLKNVEVSIVSIFPLFTEEFLSLAVPLSF